MVQLLLSICIYRMVHVTKLASVRDIFLFLSRLAYYSHPIGWARRAYWSPDHVLLQVEGTESGTLLYDRQLHCYLPDPCLPRALSHAGNGWSQHRIP